MEKPEFLYHGSPHGNIDELEPRSDSQPQSIGPLISATEDIALATIFTLKRTEVELGYLNEVLYAVFASPREELLNLDDGGFIYVLPSESFIMDSSKGMGKYEWISSQRVKPLRKIEFKSSIDAMIEKGVQVYFATKDIMDAIRNSSDHGFSIIKNLKSENMERNTNIKPLV